MSRWAKFRALSLGEKLLLLRLGVREAGAGSLAHAWVELDGEVLNNPPDVAARCAVFEPSRAHGPRRALAP